jgi:hypothetical protein
VRWIWLVALAACGDNVSPRLAQIRYDIDGVELADPQHFHDLQRDEDCVATPWADGATYCTPAFTPAAYLDPICSDPVAQTADSPSGYAATYFVLNGTVSLRRLHPIQREVAPPDEYWVLEGTECIGPYAGDSTTHFAALGPELDETRFVRIRKAPLEGDGRIQRLAVTTDDGLHILTGFHDRTLDTDCSLEFTSDVASPRCVPDASRATLFDDAACSRPVLVAPGQEPAFARYGDDACPTYAPVGDDVTGRPVFGVRGDTCAPVTLPEPYPLFSVGAPLDLAVVTREPGTGDRIQPITVVTGRLRGPDTAVHDTRLGVDCRPGMLAGSPRCLPATTSVVSYYIDDQCRDPIDVAIVTDGACSPLPRYASGTDTIYALGDAVPMQLYEVSTGDRCMPFAPLPPQVAHLLGPALPPETFAAANVRY